MLVVINDLSFEGQFSDEAAAMAALKNMAQISNSEKIKLFSGDSIFFAEVNLKDRLMTESKTIHTLLAEMMAEYTPELAILQQVLLQLFIQNTRIIEDDQKNQPVHYNGNQLVNTCVNFCFSSNIYYALFSCRDSPDYNQPIIQVEKNGRECKTLNIIEGKCIQDCTWMNKANGKKHVKKDVPYGNSTSSRMDLDDKKAQYALSNSVRLPNDGSCFYLDGNQWYKYNFEAKNIAHGFCEDTPHQQKHFSLAKKVFSDLQEERIGQIFIDYTKFAPSK